MDAAPHPDPLRLGWRAPLSQNVARQTLLLLGGALAMAWIELELRRAGVSPRVQLLGVVAAALPAAAGAARGGALFRLLTGLPFALAQLAALLLLAAAAAGAGVWPAGLGWAAEPFDRLAVQALLALLVLSTLAVAWKRRPYRPSRLGFLLVHLAPAVLALGGLWNGLAGFQGVVQVVPGTAAPLVGGLQLQLLDLELATAGREHALYVYRKPAGAGSFLPRPERLAARVGSRLASADPRCDLEVTEVLADALLERRFREDPGASEDPALFLMLGIGADPAPRGYLFSRRPGLERQQDPGGRFSFEFRERWDDPLLKEAGPGRGVLRISRAGRAEELPARPGLALAGPGWKLAVVAEYLDFAVRSGADGAPVPFSRSDQPREPWLALDLTPDGGAPRRLLLSARDPRKTAALNAPWLPPGLQLDYRWQGDAGPPRVVFTRQDLRVRLLAQGRVVRSGPLELGRPFLIEPGLSLLPLDLLVHPAEDPHFIARSVPAGAPVPAIRVKVRSAAGEALRWLEARGAEGDPVLLQEGRLGLVYRLEDPQPGDLRARLSLIDSQGREHAQGWASAQDPLEHQGFRIRPAGLSRAAPGCAVAVEKRPGAPLLRAGWGLLLAGMAWMFFLKPPLKRRERAGVP